MFCSVAGCRLGEERAAARRKRRRVKGAARQREQSKKLEKLTRYPGKPGRFHVQRRYVMRIIRFLFVRLSDAGKLRATRSLILHYDKQPANLHFLQTRFGEADKSVAASTTILIKISLRFSFSPRHENIV